MRRGAADRSRNSDDGIFDSSAALQMLVQQARQEAGEDVLVSAAHDFRQVCTRITAATVLSFHESLV